MDLDELADEVVRTRKAEQVVQEDKRRIERMSAFKKSTFQGRSTAEVARWGEYNPLTYTDRYPIKPVMRKGSLAGAFMNGPATHKNALCAPRETQVLPGVWSFAGDYMQFLREASQELDARFPPDLDEEGFTKTGLYATFDNLRCPAGYYQTPMSYTTVDNSAYRKELGLSQGYTPRQKKIAEETWRLIWSAAKPCPVNVAKMSSGGMRRHSKSTVWKLDFANFITQPDTFERMLNAVARGDALTLANEFETIYATYIQKRGQVDRVGKKRTVFDLEYALTGGARGRAFPASNKIDPDVVRNDGVWDDFCAMRARVVHAGPWTINCFLQMVSSPTMRAMFEAFPKTFHVNTAEQVESIIQGRHIYCSDVTEYDRSMSREAIEVAHEVCREFWDDRIVDASMRLYFAPYFAKPLGAVNEGETWVRNPMDWKEEVFAGNRSGHAWTSLIGKVNKVIETLFIVDLIYPVLGKVKSFLDHVQPIVMANNGDDELQAFDREDDFRTFCEHRKDRSKGHYVVDPEPGYGYSGLLIMKTDVPLKYRVTARIHTSLIKTFVPERGIDSPMRQFWPIGLNVRIGNITSTDLGREVWDVVSHVFRKNLGQRHGDISTLLMQGVEGMRSAFDGYNHIDREVLDDPDKLHYKWLADEVSDEVLDLVTSKVPQQRVETMMRRYYRGAWK